MPFCHTKGPKIEINFHTISFVSHCQSENLVKIEFFFSIIKAERVFYFIQVFIIIVIIQQQQQQNMTNLLIFIQNKNKIKKRINENKYQV